MKENNNYVDIPDNSYRNLNLPAKLLHEQMIKREEHKFALDKFDKENVHQKDLLNKKLGRVGLFFGDSKNSAKNITAVIVLSLIIGGSIVSAVIYWIKNDDELLSQIWSGIFPIITLSLGYLFGKSGYNENNTEG